MGTPEFAVPTLAAIVEAGYNVVGVITAPDKPAGRGKKLNQSAVKKFAIEQDLNVLQPTNLKNVDFVEELRNLKADIQVVVAFRMLPEVVWNMPALGSINLHGSLLPDYRGAAPIHWAVINGEPKTGVSTFFLRHAIDTGNIIMQDETPIGPNETLGEVYERLMNIGANLMVRTLEAVDKGAYKEIEQDLSKPAKHAPKIFTEDGKINWEDSAQKIHDRIRGMNPFPGAWTMLDGLKLKLHKSLVCNEKHKLECGSFKIEEKKWLVGCGEGTCIELTEIQLQNKRRMNVVDFVNGYEFEAKNFE